jgi:hypothetical protein
VEPHDVFLFFSGAAREVLNRGAGSLAAPLKNKKQRKDTDGRLL